MTDYEFDAKSETEYNTLKNKIFILMDMVIALQGDVVMLRHRCKELEAYVDYQNRMEELDR